MSRAGEPGSGQLQFNGIHCGQMGVIVMPAQISIRTSEDLVGQLDAMAEATGRTRSFLINEALREYIAREAWQVAEILKALKEADAGDFATDEEVAALDAKWGLNAR